MYTVKNTFIIALGANDTCEIAHLVKSAKMYTCENIYVQSKDFKKMYILGKTSKFLPLTTNISQKCIEPSKGISYPVGDLYRFFTKLTKPSLYILHSTLIPPTDGTNGLL